MTLDVCPNCRIQAEHRAGRTSCPRCGGPLTEVDAQTRRPVSRRTAPSQSAPPHSAESPSAESPSAPHRPAPARPVRPAPVSSATNTVRRILPNRPALRWWAHRPPETIPPPPAPARPPQPRPQYREIPRWGLIDVPPAVSADEDARGRLRWRDLGQSLRLLGGILAGAAVAQLLRYIVLVVNRSRPIPAWLDLLTVIAVLVFGVLAALGAIIALAGFARWLREVRAADYRRIDRCEPRRPILLILGAVTPFVNVVTAPFLLIESTRLRDDDEARRARRRIDRLAVAWGLVSLVGLIALVYRLVAWPSDSVQTGADALAWVTLSFAASAAFVYWAPRRFAALAEPGRSRPVPQRRLVPA